MEQTNASIRRPFRTSRPAVVIHLTDNHLDFPVVTNHSSSETPTIEVLSGPGFGTSIRVGTDFRIIANLDGFRDQREVAQLFRRIAAAIDLTLDEYDDRRAVKAVAV